MSSGSQGPIFSVCIPGLGRWKLNIKSILMLNPHRRPKRVSHIIQNRNVVLLCHWVRCPLYISSSLVWSTTYYLVCQFHSKPNVKSVIFFMCRLNFSPYIILFCCYLLLSIKKIYSYISNSIQFFVIFNLMYYSLHFMMNTIY